MAEDVGTVFGNRCFAYYIHAYTDLGTTMIIPFTHKVVDLGWVYFPLMFFVMLGTANGANFTDGLDGLASSVTVLIATFFRDCIYRGRLWCNTDYMCSRRKPAWLFGIQCLSSTLCSWGDTGSLALVICCVDSVYAADATDYIDRCIYLSGRGAFCYYSGCKLQDNWKASI